MVHVSVWQTASWRLPQQLAAQATAIITAAMHYEWPSSFPRLEVDYSGCLPEQLWIVCGHDNHMRDLGKLEHPSMIGSLAWGS